MLWDHEDIYIYIGAVNRILLEGSRDLNPK